MSPAERAITVGRQRIAITCMAATAVCVCVGVRVHMRVHACACMRACVRAVFAIHDYLTQADNDST